MGTGMGSIEEVGGDGYGGLSVDAACGHAHAFIVAIPIRYSTKRR